jgi:hypothetical protein
LAGSSAITPLACSQRPFDQALQQPLAVAEHALRLGAHDLVAQDVGELAGQVPGLEERAPVDAGGQLGQVVVAEHAPADERGTGGV